MHIIIQFIIIFYRAIIRCQCRQMTGSEMMTYERKICSEI
jgi:hypothetical protein